MASHVGDGGSMTSHARHKKGLESNVKLGRCLTPHMEHQGSWALNIGQKEKIAKEESWINCVDTLKRYESNYDFYDSNSKFLHNVVESNNSGMKEERSIVIFDLIS